MVFPLDKYVGSTIQVNMEKETKKNVFYSKSSNGIKLLIYVIYHTKHHILLTQHIRPFISIMHNDTVFMYTYFGWLYCIMKWDKKQFIQTNAAHCPVLHSRVTENPMTCEELWETKLSEYLWFESFIQHILTEHPTTAWIMEYGNKQEVEQGFKSSH